MNRVIKRIITSISAIVGISIISASPASAGINYQDVKVVCGSDKGMFFAIPSFSANEYVGRCETNHLRKTSEGYMWYWIPAHCMLHAWSAATENYITNNSAQGTYARLNNTTTTRNIALYC